MSRVPYTLLDYSGEVKSMSSQWDMTLVKDMFDGKVWNPALRYEFEEESKVNFLCNLDNYDGDSGCIVVVPARQNNGHEQDINDFINRLEWCLLILVGDEERTFDLSKINHPNMKLWLMQPKPEDEADFYIGSGYAPHTHGIHKDFDKPMDWFFSGQNNHPRRQAFLKELERMKGREDMKAELFETDGFTQGTEPKIYTSLMAQSKAIPAPSGIASPDSFRLYEGLELGGVPIADDISPSWPNGGYWKKVFADEDIPFKVVDDLNNVEGYLCDVIREYPTLSNKVFAWWQNYKYKMVYKLHEHVNQLSGLPYIQDTVRSKITVIILTSPIESHPSTKIIEQTITDIRKVLPYSEILIGVDGVREEQEHYRERYEQYKQALLWKCNNEWSNVLPVVFDEHMHQAAMTRKLLGLVKTPTLLFVEHDTALCPDFDYEWGDLVKIIEGGNANVIRFHHEGIIPEEHKYLMLGDRELIAGLPMIKTAQWSTRPHLASTSFYRDIISRYFTLDSRTFTEDVLHGKVITDVDQDGIMGWYKWRIWIYAPEGNIKRSYTTDGRKNDSKFEDKLIP